MEEIWKSIDEFENYMVSNYGRIKDLNYGNKGKERILNTSEKAALKIDNKRVYRNISTLVARAFIEDCPKGDIVVINIDGNKKNNNINNLKVMTKEEYGKIMKVDRDKLEKDFIKKFNSLHGDKWEYIGGYFNSKSSVNIKCKICGEERKAYADRLTRTKLQKELRCFKCEAIKYTNDFKIKFNNKYKGQYEYIDREYNSNVFDEDVHIVECLKCGKINKWKGQTLYNGRFNCNHLTEEQIEQRKLEKEINKEINKTLSELRNEIKQIENRNKLFEDEVDRIRECKVCGNIFIGTKRSACCSDICKKKYQNRQHDLRRRIKNKSNINNDISLEKLMQRDEGICKICGRQVDTEDYYYTDEGYFIAGENYPSIDHIIPLAKGGTHTWNNVQLAHRHCNSIKCDNIIEQEEKQLKWF